MPIDKNQASYLFAGAVALLMGAVALVGLDYTETRERAAIVPLNTQRITHVETTMKEASVAQTQATKELSHAVYELREAIAEMRGSR